MARMIFEGNGLPKHPQPFPTAVKVGNLVCSSAIGGQDPETGKVPESPEAQIHNAFHHVATILRLSGGSLADIAKVTVYLKDRDTQRDMLNAEWIRLFPDEQDRPVRHTLEGEFSGHRMIQVEFMAMVPDAAR